VRSKCESTKATTVKAVAAVAYADGMTTGFNVPLLLLHC